MKKFFVFALTFMACALNLFAQDCVEIDINLPGTASITFSRFEHKTLTGVFCVGEGKYVTFSQGNLQFQASTGLWRFAEEQYESLRGASYTHNGTLYRSGNHIGADRDTQARWIDLFGWATSGWDGKGAGIEYQPWATNSDNTAYRDGVSPIDLTGDYAKADWAFGNVIINGGQDARGPRDSIWYLLTYDELAYLIKTRATGVTVNGTANARYTMATVNTDGTPVKGLLLFPEGFAGAVTAGVTWGTINSSSNYVTTCTIDGWKALEEAGCVFLPTTGSRDADPKVSNASTHGYYWTSTDEGTTTKSCQGLRFYGTADDKHGVNVPNSIKHNLGCAVRAVRHISGYAE